MGEPNLVRLRVQGFHCDLYGHVNNARYLEFLEGARWETLDHLLDVEAFHRRGWTFVIVRIEIDYRAPSTLGDELGIRTWRVEMGQSSVKLRQIIRRPADDRLVAEAMVRFVVIDDRTGRPKKVSGRLREELELLPALPAEGGDPA